VKPILAHPTVEAVKAIHAEVLAAHGGSTGLRDEALLESAGAAPQATMMGAAMFTDPVEIASAYLFYLCRNHPFVDGNKRTAFVALETFLVLNELQLTAGDAEATVMMLDMASGTVSEAMFIEWVRTSVVKQ
jgi:death-on-curing protein